MESEKGGIAVATGWTINKIDAYNKTAYLQNGRPIKYDKCLIATGNYKFLLFFNYKFKTNYFVFINYFKINS